MLLSVERSQLYGEVRMPGSKSHTIRAVAIGSLASGDSLIEDPLDASDVRSAVDTYRGLGAQIDLGEPWLVSGVAGRPSTPGDVLNVGNSGTTLYIAMGTAALGEGFTVFTGDEQIRSRPAGPLLDALRDLGANAFSTRGNGRPPLVIGGPMRGGRVVLDGSKTSQYLTSLLINCPLAQGDTEIVVRNAVEIPYIEMTLRWLTDRGIDYERDGFDVFRIPGGQQYENFSAAIPGDFSSATFFLCAAAVTRSEVTLFGLDMADTQGDKAVVDMLRAMGTRIEEAQGGLVVTGGDLRGGEFDLGATPDALPAMAVTACYAEGTTRLVNVAQARLKETDRIAVMCRELTAMGGRVRELPDGLEIEGSPLHAANVRGYGDHRVVMALAVAGLGVDGRTVIDTAEAVSVTFPSFPHLMQALGANLEIRS